MTVDFRPNHFGPALTVYDARIFIARIMSFMTENGARDILGATFLAQDRQIIGWCDIRLT